MLVEGFEHRQMMMNYNYPHCATLLQEQGLGKEVDFLSRYADKKACVLLTRRQEVPALIRVRMPM